MVREADLLPSNMTHLTADDGNSANIEPSTCHACPATGTVSLLEANQVCEAYVKVHSREDAAHEQQRQACFAETNAVPACHHVGM